MQDTKPPMSIPAVQYSTFIWDLALGVHGKFLRHLYKTKWNVRSYQICLTKSLPDKPSKEKTTIYKVRWRAALSSISQSNVKNHFVKHQAIVSTFKITFYKVFCKSWNIFFNLRIKILQSILKYQFLSGTSNFSSSIIQISQIAKSLEITFPMVPKYGENFAKYLK